MAKAHFETILFVDDDAELRAVVAAALAKPGYVIVTAPDAFDAVRILAYNRVSLLITDIKMPGVDGFELAQQARALRPDIQIIYLSGYPIENPHGGAVLKKPLRMDDLLAEISGRLH